MLVLIYKNNLDHLLNKLGCPPVGGETEADECARRTPVRDKIAISCM